MNKDIFEELIVVKRSGQRVSFNNYKIAVAIKQAFDYVYSNYNEKKVNSLYEDVLKNIEINYHDRKTINVEDIQDIIENTLKEEGYKEVYKAFSEYRKKRAASRKVFTIKQQHKFVKAMEKIAEDNSLRTENDFKPNELLISYGKTVVKEFSKSYLIDNKFLRAHAEANIFIHDLELFSLGILSSTHLNLKEAFNQEIIDIILNLTKVKNEVNGEINIPSIDYLLEDCTLFYYKNIFKEYLINYLKLTGYYEYINYKKILEQIDKENNINIKIDDYKNYIYSEPVENVFKKALEDALTKIKEIIKENLITLFCTLNKEKIYSLSFGTNNSLLGNLINEVILDILKEKAFSNLKIIFKLKKDETIYINSVIDLLFKNEITISFLDSSYNKDLNEVEYFPSGIRIFENINSTTRESIGRMVVAKTSININRLALKNKNKPVKDFYKELEEGLELVKNNLLLAFETIGNKNKENYEILFNNNILDDEKLEISQKIRKVIKNGVLLIGIVGLKECVLTLESDQNKQFKLAIDILDFLNKNSLNFANDTKLNFQIYEPSEEKVRKEFMALDKTIFGINKNITEDFKYDLISNLQIIKNDYKKQGVIQKKFIGGNVLEINLPSNSSKKRVLEIINDLIDSDVGFVKLSLGKKK